MALSFPFVRAIFFLLALCGPLLGSCSDAGPSPIGPRDAEFKVETIEPYAARPGAKVKLRGYGFGRDPQYIRIVVGGAVVDSLLWLRTDVIEFIVPENASGEGLLVEKIVLGNGQAVLYPFSVITSRYGYSSFSVSLSGVMGKRIWDQSKRDSAVRGGVDTSEAKFGYTGKIGRSGVSTCSGVTRGDTVRICAHSGSAVPPRHNDLFTHDDEQGSLYGVVDTVRKVLRRVQINYLGVFTMQPTPLESRMTRRGTILLLDDLPYQIGDEGDLVVVLTGSALREKVLSYQYSLHDSRQEAGYWYAFNEEIDELAAFPDSAALKLRLYN